MSASRQARCSVVSSGYYGYHLTIAPLPGDDFDSGDLHDRSAPGPALAQVPHELPTRYCHITRRWQRHCILPVHHSHLAGLGAALVPPPSKPFAVRTREQQSRLLTRLIGQLLLLNVTTIEQVRAVSGARCAHERVRS